MGNIGTPEIFVVFIVALLVLGPNRLPQAARQVGKAMAEFRRVTGGLQAEMRDAMSTIENEVKGASGVAGPQATPPASARPAIFEPPAVAGPAAASEPPAVSEPLAASEPPAVFAPPAVGPAPLEMPVSEAPIVPPTGAPITPLADAPPEPAAEPAGPVVGQGDPAVTTEPLAQPPIDTDKPSDA